jgi:cytochrome c oxidase subunit 2
MALWFVAEQPEQYEAWAERQRQPGAAPVDDRQKRGQQVFLSSTCAMCHHIGGTPASATLGPDLTHLASRKTIAAGPARGMDT